MYALEDPNGRQRMLKYTPEHMHCLAVVWGASAPPNTGACGATWWLSPMPRALRPKPYAPSPMSQALCPEPYTRSPAPQALEAVSCRAPAARKRSCPPLKGLARSLEHHALCVAFLGHE